METVTNGEKKERKPPRKFSDEEKAAIIEEANGCATRKEVREVLARHKIQLHQLQKWREKTGKSDGRKVRKRVEKAEETTYAESAIIVAFADYLLSLERRVAALEANRDRLARALEGK